MIAWTDKDGRVTVSGTGREWLLFLERLDAKNLEKTGDADRARAILIVASAVPFNGVAPNKR
jgi:hypothetical protein